MLRTSLLAILFSLSATAALATAAPFDPEPGILSDRIPEPVLQVSGKSRYVLLVEKDYQRMHLLRVGDEIELLETYPCTTGKNLGDKEIVGDEKTPEGVYFFTKHIDDAGLVEMYGEQISKTYGAGAFPMDYPNFFDRRDGRRGSGIWLHGVEYDGREHKPRDTRGCVAVANTDFEGLRDLIELRDTPIIVRTSVDWVPRSEWEKEREDVWRTVSDWATAWESKDIEAYIDQYAEDYRNQGMDREGWKRYKEQFNRRYAWIDVELEDIGIFKEADDRVVVDFVQKYNSDRYKADGRKRLFLQHTPEGWKIQGEQYRPLSTERRATSIIAAASKPTVVSAPAATAAPVAKPASKRAALPIAGTVEFEDFVAELQDGAAKVSFLLENKSDEPQAGYVTVAALDRAGNVLGNHPPFATLRGGKPVEPRRGEWFFMQGSTNVDAIVPLKKDTVHRLLVFAHARDGSLLAREEFTP